MTCRSDCTYPSRGGGNTFYSLNMRACGVASSRCDLEEKLCIEYKFAYMVLRQISNGPTRASGS